RRRQDQEGSLALPQTAHQRRRLPAARRRPGKGREGGPGRATGGDYEDQRGRSNPDDRLFDQATTRAPQADYARCGTSLLTTERCHSVRLSEHPLTPMSGRVTSPRLTCIGAAAWRERFLGSADLPG